MANDTFSNLSDEVRRALKGQASQHGQGKDAEAVEILALAAIPVEPVQLGDQLRALGQAFGGVELRSTRATESMRVADLS